MRSSLPSSYESVPQRPSQSVLRRCAASGRRPILRGSKAGQALLKGTASPVVAGGPLIDKIGSYSSPSSFGVPRRSFMKSTNARTLGESSRLLANTMLTSTGGIDQSGKSGTSCPEANAG